MCQIIKEKNMNTLLLIWSLLTLDCVYSFQSLRSFKNSKVFINNGKKKRLP